MSILIHGMDMPTGNSTKNVLVYSDGTVFTGHENDAQYSACEFKPERKKGYWIFGHTLGHSWMKCSECLVSQDGQTACFSYCPNCGADMRGERDE